MNRDLANEWIVKAEEDLRIIENEMEFVPEDRIITSAICFHAQQAVEKYLKAFLAFNDIKFGKTHNLELLLEMCRKKSRNLVQ